MVGINAPKDKDIVRRGLGQRGEVERAILLGYWTYSVARNRNKFRFLSGISFLQSEIRGSPFTSAVKAGLVGVHLAEARAEAEHELDAFDFGEPIGEGRVQFIFVRPDDAGGTRGAEIALGEGAVAIDGAF